ncbi:MAG: hypothetical protein LC808_26625, partial [Actinobacteria bacterium]|nr:hypothetical protein [Actinomycetota bacterium]
VGPVAEEILTITSPRKGRKVKRYSRVAIRTSLADGFAVSKVQTWVNGWLKSSDRRAPYVYEWFVRSRPGTRNRIRVMAYDITGKRTTARIVVTTASRARRP